MRVSRSVATLLAGYGFDEYMFVPCSSAGLQRSVALYERYQMRILHIQLPAEWHEPLIDSETRRSLLPASLLELTVGMYQPPTRTTRPAPLIASNVRPTPMSSETLSHTREFLKLIQPVDARLRHDRAWNVQRYSEHSGVSNAPIPPGALPQRLRFLLLNKDFNQPLSVGSIPDSVAVLQFGSAFNQPLASGHLPASLTHLVFNGAFNQRLRPGVLPAGLRRLHLGWHNNQPMQRGVLPPQLQELSFAADHDQPITLGVVPPSVTHLRLGAHFNQPLLRGSIPHGVVHLNVGDSFDHPLPPGVLPSSVRELALGRWYGQVAASASGLR